MTFRTERLVMRVMNCVLSLSSTMSGDAPPPIDRVAAVEPKVVVMVLRDISVIDQSAYRYAHRYTPRMAGRMIGMIRAVCESAEIVGCWVNPSPDDKTLTWEIAPLVMTAPNSRPKPPPPPE